MKERKKFVGQKEKDDAIMNFVSRQAQEAILDPNLPETIQRCCFGGGSGCNSKDC